MDESTFPSASAEARCAYSGCKRDMPEQPTRGLCDHHSHLPACDVDGCEQVRRKRDWCAAHYSQWTRKGEVKPFGYKWGAKGLSCRVCGQQVEPNTRRREFCSGRCQMMGTRYKDGRPTSRPCAACGDSIDFLAPTRKGQFRRVDAVLCTSCKQQTRWAMTAEELAARDGLACGICGDSVDMALRFPDVMRRSVDHVTPRANGGLDVPENLQLAHLRCNASKSNRTVTSAMRM